MDMGLSGIIYRIICKGRESKESDYPLGGYYVLYSI